MQVFNETNSTTNGKQKIFYCLAKTKQKPFATKANTMFTTNEAVDAYNRSVNSYREYPMKVKVVGVRENGQRIKIHNNHADEELDHKNSELPRFIVLEVTILSCWN